MISRLALAVVRRLYKSLLRRNIWLKNMCPYHGVRFQTYGERHYIGCYKCQDGTAAERDKTADAAEQLWQELERLP